MLSLLTMAWKLRNTITQHDLKCMPIDGQIRDAFRWSCNRMCFVWLIPPTLLHNTDTRMQPKNIKLVAWSTHMNMILGSGLSLGSSSSSSSNLGVWCLPMDALKSTCLVCFWSVSMQWTNEWMKFRIFQRLFWNLCFQNLRTQNIQITAKHFRLQQRQQHKPKTHHNTEQLEQNCRQFTSNFHERNAEF